MIIFIHGANATPRSFAWLREKLDFECCNFVWSVNDPLNDTIQRCVEFIENINQPVVVIGHSLGGVIAVAVSRLTRVRGVVTMAAPFAGSRLAGLMRWWVGSQLFHDLRPSNPLYHDIMTNFQTVPTLAFVTRSEGLPMIGESNDGVVTVASQLNIRGAEFNHVSLNHFEVLMDDSVLVEMKKFLGELR